MIRVNVSVGVGEWMAHATTVIIACPHVGDYIEVRGRAIYCEHVCICEQHVDVRYTVRFTSKEQADHYFDD